jgi:hypothetical protein
MESIEKKSSTQEQKTIPEEMPKGTIVQISEGLYRKEIIWHKLYGNGPPFVGSRYIWECHFKILTQKEADQILVGLL